MPIVYKGKDASTMSDAEYLRAFTIHRLEEDENTFQKDFEKILEIATQYQDFHTHVFNAIQVARSSHEAWSNCRTKNMNTWEKGGTLKGVTKSFTTYSKAQEDLRSLKKMIDEIQAEQAAWSLTMDEGVFEEVEDECDSIV